MSEEKIELLKEKVLREKELILSLIKLDAEKQKLKEESEKVMISSQMDSIKSLIKKKQSEINEILSQISIKKSLTSQIREEIILKNEAEYPLAVEREGISPPMREEDLFMLEKISLKRLRKKEAVKKIKTDGKPSKYVNLSVRNFYNLSRNLINDGMFGSLKRNLVKANMQFIPENYISVMFFTTLLSFFFAIFLFVFLLFFELSSAYPIISISEESFQTRALRNLWMLFVIPIGTLLMIYFYPSLEKKTIESKVNQELPFVTIHMSSIAGAMMDPSKMFAIIISTGEYPTIQKEFAKILNDVNLYGYDLVSALRNSAFNCPSSKLAELYNGISTTVNSGGSLTQFFEKRAETLLFDYKLEREKYNKSTETFMDIYLSVVIAAPMILMLLLIIMRVSGLGISLSTPMISLVTILGVTIANVFFLTFLHLKQPAQ